MLAETRKGIHEPVILGERVVRKWVSMGALSVEFLLWQGGILLVSLQRLLVFLAPSALCWFAGHGDLNV